MHLSYLWLFSLDRVREQLYVLFCWQVEGESSSGKGERSGAGQLAWQKVPVPDEGVQPPPLRAGLYLRLFFKAAQ